MTTNARRESIEKEGRILMAIGAFKRGQFKSQRAAAAAFDIDQKTVSNRLKGKPARVDTPANGRKLDILDENVLKEWIISADERGLPPQTKTVRRMAAILAQKDIGVNWVTRFVNRHEDIRSRYTKRYDYQRALCEDPKKIGGWFQLVNNMTSKYGIQPEDIYNFDETGFAMGIIATSKVITSQNDRRARVCQPGNQEWVTIIEAIQSTGRVLPPMIIFAGQMHQKEWYTELPDNWAIATSSNGWTNNELGLLWLKEVFHKYTKDQTVGAYRLLVLDGHGSHATADFDHFCKENKIIPLYMPPHSSHLLQPLDIACFGPLKKRYGSEIQNCMAANIQHIDKRMFLNIYKDIARPGALTGANVIAGFTATGLVPYKPERVLDNLHFQLHTPTPPPPGSSDSSGSSWTAETPKTAKDLKKQSQLIK